MLLGSHVILNVLGLILSLTGKLLPGNLRLEAWQILGLYCRILFWSFFCINFSLNFRDSTRSTGKRNFLPYTLLTRSWLSLALFLFLSFLRVLLSIEDTFFISLKYISQIYSFATAHSKRAIFSTPSISSLVTDPTCHHLIYRCENVLKLSARQIARSSMWKSFLAVK